MRQSNILDPIQDELDQRVFRGTEPRPNVVNFIKRLYARAFAHEFSVPLEAVSSYVKLVLTGSLTTYQYGDTSDCDISVFPNWDAFKELGLDPAETRRDLVVMNIDKLDGTFLPGGSHPLQFFTVAGNITPEIQFQPGLRSGYDLDTREWIVPPEKERSHDIALEYPDVYQRASDIAEKMSLMLDTDQPELAKELWKQVHKKRQLDQRAGLGDFSEGNIVYKWLVHQGLVDRLRKELHLQIATHVKETVYDDFEDIKKIRIPFYIMPNGTFETGLPGMEHREIPERRWLMNNFKRPGTVEGEYQGHVIFHPEEGELYDWPIDFGTLQEQPWLTDEMKQRVLENARGVWNAHNSKVAVEWNRDELDPRVLDQRDTGMEAWELLEQQIEQLAASLDTTITWIPRNMIWFAQLKSTYDLAGGLTLHFEARIPHITGEFSYWVALHELGHASFRRQYAKNITMLGTSVEEELWAHHFVLEHSQIAFAPETIEAMEKAWKTYDTGMWPDKSRMNPNWTTSFNLGARTAAAKMKVIYDFEKDRIILGSEAATGQTVVIGEYDEDEKAATLFEAEKNWINPTYFRRLWNYSYPHRPLKEVHFQRGENKRKLKTRDHPHHERHIRSMAERTGDPQLDALIEEFMKRKTDWTSAPGTFEAPRPLMDFRDPEVSWGQCNITSASFRQFLTDHGITNHWFAGYEHEKDRGRLVQKTPAPPNWPFTDVREIGYEDADLSMPGTTHNHCAVEVEVPSGRYMIDFTATQFGYTEFPMVQKLNPSGWQREFSSHLGAKLTLHEIEAWHAEYDAAIDAGLDPAQAAQQADMIISFWRSGTDTDPPMSYSDAPSIMMGLR
jgi:hypothetical protein